MNGFIYKITNKVNNKIYIGKTMTSIGKRFQEHIRESRKKEPKIVLFIELFVNMEKRILQ